MTWKSNFEKNFINIMKKLLLSFFLIISIGFIYIINVSGYEKLDQKTINTIDKVLENFNDKILSKSIDSQISIYKNFQLKIKILQEQYTTSKNLSILNYLNQQIEGNISELSNIYIIDNKSSESYSNSAFGLHPGKVLIPEKEYTYMGDLGANWDRESVYFFWNWIDINKDGVFSFKSAQPTVHPLYGKQAPINYDNKKINIPVNVNLVNNICPSKNSTLKTESDKEYYSDFVNAVVERYDGDDDFGCKVSAPDCYVIGDAEYPDQELIERIKANPIKHWQVCNQLFDTCKSKDECDHYEKFYAEVQEITYKEVKKADPTAKVLIAGDSAKEEYVKVYQELNGKYIDIIDFHRFGTKEDYNPEDDIEYLKNELEKSNFNLKKLEFWITETGTYSGQPQEKEGKELPYQSEKEQAIGLVKYYVSSFRYGIDKVFWAWNILEGFGCDCCIFDYTGLIYDGNQEPQSCNINDPYDLGFGVKKLGYFSYKLLVNKLENFDGDDIKIIQESDDIYVYEFRNNDSGKKTWIAWSDSNLGKLSLNKLGIDSVKITQSVPDYKNGLKIENARVSFEDMFEVNYLSDDILLSEIPIFIEEVK